MLKVYIWSKSGKKVEIDSLNGITLEDICDEMTGNHDEIRRNFGSGIESCMVEEDGEYIGYVWNNYHNVYEFVRED